MHSDSSGALGGENGPSGITIADGKSHMLHGSQSQPALSGGRQRIRPKSSPFIRFGSTGIQELLERKRRGKK